MKKLFAGLVCVCSAFSSVIANDDLNRVYELDSFEPPGSETVVDSLVQAGDMTSGVEEYVPELASILLREPGQIFLSQSVPFAPVFQKSENAQPEHGRQFPRPRPELRWMMTESLEPLLQQFRAQAELPHYRGATTIGNIAEVKSEPLSSEEKYRLLNLYHGFRQR